MIVLTRKLGEKIYIGDSIVVTVTEIQGRRVKLGVQAPKDLRIDREEVWLERQEQAALERGETP